MPQINQYPTTITPATGANPFVTGDLFDVDKLIDEDLLTYESQKITYGTLLSYLGGVQTITGPAVDNTDPLNPIINSTFGLYAQTVASSVINTTGEQSIIGTGVGALTIPANAFLVGDSYHAKIGGLMNATGGGGRSEITINIKAGAIILATTGQFELDTATNQGWEMELDFTIAAIGAVGQICTNGNFVYTKDANRTIFGYIFQDVQAIDTTILNTLDVTIEFNVLNTGDDIYSANFVLYKTF